jgi:hypothetical protein
MNASTLRTKVSRLLAPILAVLIGVGALIFGLGFHSRTVSFDERIELEPPPVPIDPFTGEPIGPPPEPVTITETREVNEPEARLVSEVTRGGVERREDGRIARTYTAGEEPPSQCPT